MCFRVLYTSIYNISLSFIKIERKTNKEDARIKSTKKTGSPRRSGLPRRSIPSPRWSRQGLEDGLEFAQANRPLLRRALLRLGGEASGWNRNVKLGKKLKLYEKRQNGKLPK